MPQTEFEVLNFTPQCGDVLAMTGAGMISRAIRWVTRAPVSHVSAIISPTHLIESTIIDGDGRKGVVDRTIEYKLQDASNVWWVPLRPEWRKWLDEKKFVEYLHTKIGRGYGKTQAVLAGLGIPQPDSALRLFCSELIAFANREAIQGVPRHLNPSGTTPIELCRWPIYAHPIRLKGTKELRIDQHKWDD